MQSSFFHSIQPNNLVNEDWIKEKSRKPLHSCVSKNNSTSSRGCPQLTITQPINPISSTMHAHNWPAVQNCPKKIQQCALKWTTRGEVVLQHDACIIKVRMCCADDRPTPLGTEIGSRTTRGSWDRKLHLVIMHSLIPCKCHALLINGLTASPDFVLWYV